MTGGAGGSGGGGAGGNLGSGGAAGSSGGSGGADALTELVIDGNGNAFPQSVAALADTTNSDVVLAYATGGQQALLAFTDLAGAENGIEIAYVEVARQTIGAPIRVTKTNPSASQLAAAASGSTFLLAYTTPAALIELVTFNQAIETTVGLTTTSAVTSVVAAGGSNSFLVCWTTAATYTVQCSARKQDGTPEGTTPTFTAVTGGAGALDSLSMAYVSGTYALLYHDGTASEIGFALVAEGSSQSTDLGLQFLHYDSGAIAARATDFVYVLIRQNDMTLDGGVMQKDGVLSAPQFLGNTGQLLSDLTLACDLTLCTACWYVSDLSNSVGCGVMNTTGGLALANKVTVYYLHGAAPQDLPFRPALAEMSGQAVVVLPPPGSTTP
jgi:hypothetical protein